MLSSGDELAMGGEQDSAVQIYVRPSCQPMKEIGAGWEKACTKQSQFSMGEKMVGADGVVRSMRVSSTSRRASKCGFPRVFSHTSTASHSHWAKLAQYLPGRVDGLGEVELYRGSRQLRP